uniref:Uncharacterized protein MANES_18G099000 n=1 Tax=Rhizophora mucronata TaxID=61149 RepID=A0A2P2KKL2_RHIMU
MQFISRWLPRLRHHCLRRLQLQQQQQQRSFVDLAAVKHIRDRGLDHAVEREKHLRPMLNIKNLIRSEPSKSLPLSVISQQKDSLKIPSRPIEFIRKYPLVFEEFLPGGIGIQPHIKLTSQVLDIDTEEQLVYQRENYKQCVADRLLKLLMISRIDKIPLKILDTVNWDLGLSPDYVKRIVPEFPDCFRIIGKKGLSSGSDSELELELVCWSNELSVSVMENKTKCAGLSYEKGKPISYPMQFSRGFEINKKLKKCYDEWQKLPYISPYENAMHLGPSSDESDKWVVGILHEILNLFVSKKVDRDTLLCLGEWLGIRSRFKRALLHHPGIFYLSSKMGTYTVVLREAYKRGLLIENNYVMNIRNQYLHLMHMVIERKAVARPGGTKPHEQKKSHDSKAQKENDNYENDAEVHQLGSDFEDDSDEEQEYDYDNDDGEGTKRKTSACRNFPATMGRVGRKNNLDIRVASRNARRGRLAEKQYDKAKDKFPTKDSCRTEIHKRNRLHARSLDRSDSPKSKKKLLTEK